MQRVDSVMAPSLESPATPRTAGTHETIDNSEFTEDTTFSALAKGEKGKGWWKGAGGETPSKGSLRLKDRSWAALTSGFADVGWASR